MSFAGAYMLLTTLGTVLFLPLLAPRLIEGLTVDAWSLAKPLLIMVLLPLLIGGAIRVFAPRAAEKLFPVVSRIGGLFLMILLALTLVIYGRDMLSAVGSFAPAAQILFFVGITAISYKIHFGLAQQQRSAMAVGMCTRNIAAVFAAYTGIMDPPSGLFVMVILVVPLAAVVAFAAAPPVRPDCGAWTRTLRSSWLSADPTFPMRTVVCPITWAGSLPRNRTCW